MSRYLPVQFHRDTATEHSETAALLERVALSCARWPELELMFHPANEGKRSAAAAGKLKAEGMKKGVPDLWLPVARGVFHGLVIEMKRPKYSHPTAEQYWWLERLEAQGYAARWCAGQDQAWGVIEDYLKGELK